jgi:hypothetical protein
MKILNKIGIVCALLAVCVSARAQLIGSWQGTSDEGWIDWGNGLSITNPANTNKYQFIPGAVTGYNQSLQISQGGFNQSLSIKLENLPGGKAAFLKNQLLSFTFSVPAAAVSGSTGGFSQLYQLVVNASGLGFQGQTYSTNTWSATGSTGNNGANGQPNFYFYSGAPARSQTVVFNYSNLLSQITATTNSGYIELIFTFNNGGGAPTNFFINNVQLLGAPVQVPAGAYIVDDFSPAGVSTSNPTNYDYYNSSQVYSTGLITNVWWSWFGSAFVSDAWDPNTDAGNNPTSGSLEVSVNWTNGNQFLIWDQGANNDFYALNISGLQYTNFQCDVKFAPGSASDSGTFGQPIFGHLQFGIRTPSYAQDYFGAVDVPATNTGWVHVSVPLNAVADTNLLNMGGLLIHMYAPFYSLNLVGTTTFWVDNIKFTGPTTAVTNPPPTLALSPATPALRIFAGSAVNTYDREELATADNNQTWVGGGTVRYSFSLLDYPRNINQTHIFLVPTATSGQANMGNAGTPNEFIEYQASNTLWMVLNPGANGAVVASVQWKTNLPNANPNITALSITNPTAVGTWTLTFNSATTGTLTAPGAAPKPFTITDPNVLTDFTNPCVAYFGVQPNSTTGEGQFEDWGSIAVSGVSGVSESENFVNEATFNANNYWTTNCAFAGSLQPVPPGNPYWISWTLPALGYGLGAASAVNGASNTPNPWMLPEYFNSYNNVAPGGAIPGQTQEGTSEWVLVPAGCLPTVDGSQGGTPAPDAFFELFNPALTQ